MCDSVARGNFDTRVPVVRDDEIGLAAKAFNGMAARVGEIDSVSRKSIPSSTRS